MNNLPTVEKKINTKVRIELTYDMLASNLQMKSQSPTVVIAGVLRKAEFVTPKELREKALGAPRVVLIEYDLETDKIEVESDASSLIYLGIIVMAHSMMTQNQLLQRMQAKGSSGLKS